MPNAAVQVLCAAAFLVALSLSACSPRDPAKPSLDVIDAPGASERMWPHLAIAHDGNVYISWLERQQSGHALHYSNLQPAGWSAPQTIASGDDWFVNWADFPSLVSGPTGMAAHWLAKREGGTYAYDIAMRVKPKHATAWPQSFSPHSDNTSTEHGFVSIEPNEQGFDMIWLDGRNMSQAGAATDDHSGHGGGAMSLRYAQLDAHGTLLAESQLDAMTCECCQTDLVRSDAGLVGVYRDRTEAEVRDVAVIFKGPDGFAQPQVLGDDGWQIDGCPVNGPAVAASGLRVAAAWFSAADENPRVQLALSVDGGQTFASPLLIADGSSVLGRVDVVSGRDGTTAVSWLARDDAGQTWLTVRRVAQDGSLADTHQLAAIDSGRASGFPQMVLNEQRLVFAWTASDNGSKTIRTATLPLASLE